MRVILYEWKPGWIVDWVEGHYPVAGYKQTSAEVSPGSSPVQLFDIKDLAEVMECALIKFSCTEYTWGEGNYSEEPL